MTTEIISIGVFSDGDATHRPKPEWTAASPTIYYEKLGTQWMQKMGRARPGIRYYLDQLPAGYALFERPRPTNAKIKDRHLYGHPSHKFFDSPNRFYPHFEHLMEKQTSDGCPCTICVAGGGTKLAMGRPSVGSSTTAPRPTPKAASVSKAPKALEEPIYVDEEATPDTIQTLIDKLKQAGQLDIDIQEKLSMDWRAEHKMITESIKDTVEQPSWQPRVGEVVLFLRNLGSAEIALDAETKQYRLYKDKIWLGYPSWEAGVIGQVPQGQLHESDLIQESKAQDSVVYTGFRIEPLPDSDSKDKAFTKQHKYVPMSHIRPFMLYKEFLNGIPEPRWHPTINNARKIMSTTSLVSRDHFKGTWPTARISCRGVFIGPELLCSGDTVRLSTEEAEFTILHIDSIKLELTNLDAASSNDEDEAHPYSSTIYLYGHAFTTDQSTAFKDAGHVRLPSILAGYDGIKWHPVHDQQKKYKVSFNRVASRLYEANALLLWSPASTGDKQTTTSERLLDIGLSGISHARRYSSLHNKRIPDSKQWYWGDSRAESLDIETLNGINLSYYDDMRNNEKISEWETAARVLENKASKEERAGYSIMASARTKVGGTMHSRPSITAADVAEAAKEEGLDEHELMGNVEDLTASNTGQDSNDFLIEDSQDELDPNNSQEQDVMAAFGLTEQEKPDVETEMNTYRQDNGSIMSATGLAQKAQHVAAHSSYTRKWPSSAIAEATTETAEPPLHRGRGRPAKAKAGAPTEPKSVARLPEQVPKKRGRPPKTQQTSLKRELVLLDDELDTDDTVEASTVLAAFKKPKSSQQDFTTTKKEADVIMLDSDEDKTKSNALAAFKRSKTKQPQFSPRREKEADVVMDDSDEDTGADAAVALAAFQIPRRKVSVVINVD